MTKPWEETWAISLHGDSVVKRDPDRPPMEMTVAFGPMDDTDMRLIAAAPAMARALCMLIGAATDHVDCSDGHDRDAYCPRCQPVHDAIRLGNAAFDAAGLTPEDREAVRKNHGR